VLDADGVYVGVIGVKVVYVYVDVVAVLEKILNDGKEVLKGPVGTTAGEVSVG
jgi:hypothetical protein